MCVCLCVRACVRAYVFNNHEVKIVSIYDADDGSETLAAAATAANEPQPTVCDRGGKGVCEGGGGGGGKEVSAMK